MIDFSATSFTALIELHLYPLLYIGTGILTLLISGGSHLWHHRHSRREPNSLVSLMEEMHPEQKKLWHRIRASVIVPVLAVIAMALLWPLAWWMKCAELLNEHRMARQKEAEVFRVQAQHLLEKLTIEEIEARELVQDPLNAVPRQPFGHLNSVWSELKSRMQPGDELWSFTATWTGAFGWPQLRKGYAVRRRRKPVGHMLTMCKDLELDHPTALAPPQPTGLQRQHVGPPMDEIEIPAFLRKDAD